MKRPDLPKYYIARDRSGIVWLFPDKPVKDEISGRWCSRTFRIHLEGTLSMPEHGKKLQPHWEDKEPIEIALLVIPFGEVDSNAISRIDILTR